MALRRLFVETVPEEDVTRFVFVDETSTTLTYCRRYGRAPAGRRLDQAVPLQRQPECDAPRRPNPRRPRGADER